MFRFGSGDDEPTDAHPVARLYAHAGREVDRLWRRRALYPAVVDFHQANAGAVVHSGEQSGIKAWRQDRGYGRLKVVCGRETGRGNFRGLRRIILPVVIGNEKRSITVSKLQGWIGQRRRDTSGSQTGAKAAHDDSVIARVVTQNEACDDDVATCRAESTCADIGQLRQGGLTEVVDFEQGHTCDVTRGCWCGRRARGWRPAGCGSDHDVIDPHTRHARRDAAVVGGCPPFQLDILSTGCGRQVDCCRDVGWRGCRPTGKPTPGRSTGERIAKVRRDSASVAAGDEAAPSGKDVSKRSAVDFDLENHAIETGGSIGFHVEEVLERQYAATRRKRDGRRN